MGIFAKGKKRAEKAVKNIEPTEEDEEDVKDPYTDPSVTGLDRDMKQKKKESSPESFFVEAPLYRKEMEFHALINAQLVELKEIKEGFKELGKDMKKLLALAEQEE